jgi:3-mercaptopyruvate sulfurtransferase SseA
VRGTPWAHAAWGTIVMGYTNVTPLNDGFNAWRKLAQQYPELIVKK